MRRVNLNEWLSELAYVPTLILGFLLGVEHTSEADHLAAMSSLVTRSKSLRTSARLGMFWGIGHSLTLLAAGIALLVTKALIPTKLQLSFEFAVGIMLVILGASVVVRTWRDRVHIHAHEHESRRHIHFHSHRLGESHTHGHYSLLVGVVHGLAGTGGLIVLALSTAKSFTEGVAYIIVFGVGTTIGMVGLSALIGVPFMATSMKFQKVGLVIRSVAGLLSVGLGVLLSFGVYPSLFVI